MFTAEASENLVAVAFYATGPDTTYTVYVYDTFDGSVFSDLLGSKSGSLANEGYHTITLDLDPSIALTEGDEFGIAVRVTTPGTTWPMACEGYLSGYASAGEVHDGESYLSSDGSTWEPGYTGDPYVDLNVCIKGLAEGIPEGTVATPTFSPLPGTYTGPVSIFCSTLGATIHYTLNESEPSEGSPTYSTPITLTETTTIKAKAYKTAMTASATASGTYTVGAGGTLCEALDNCDLVWTNDNGDDPWETQTVVTHDGADAAKSPDIDDNQSSYIETEVTGPGQVSFWWKVSSEDGYDFLRFYVDYDVQEEISGNLDWQHVTFGIGPGAHILKWEYYKDVSESYYDDCGWVDEVQFGLSGSINVLDSILPADDHQMPFDTLVQGTAHSEHVVIQNTDLANPLTVSSINFQGDEKFNTGVATDAPAPAEPPVKALAGAFYLANVPTLPAVVAPGGSITFDVRFIPSAPGTFESDLVISSNDYYDTSTVSIALSGEATPGGLPAAGTAALAILAGAIATAAAIKNRRRR